MAHCCIEPQWGWVGSGLFGYKESGEVGGQGARDPCTATRTLDPWCLEPQIDSCEQTTEMGKCELKVPKLTYLFPPTGLHLVVQRFVCFNPWYSSAAPDRVLTFPALQTTSLTPFEGASSSSSLSVEGSPSSRTHRAAACHSETV